MGCRNDHVVLVVEGHRIDSLRVKFYGKVAGEGVQVLPRQDIEVVDVFVHAARYNSGIILPSLGLI